MIYGSRVRQARLFLGETQSRFAIAVNLAQSQLSHVENSGLVDLAEARVLAISEHTGFPPQFFETAPSAPIEDVQFRARLTFRAVDRYRAVTCAELVHESYVAMHERVESSPVEFPHLTGMAPAAAAKECRLLLGLPSGPIANLTLPVERKGIAILALPMHGQKHDAFSWWHDGTNGGHPIIATLAGAPGDRYRWNVAHELGHLALHMRGESGREIEQQADEFAAELLTPRDSMAREIPHTPKLSALYAMKVRWGVSVQSLIRRAREVGRLSDEQYMSLFRQVSARGERMKERYQIEREKPRLYRKMAEVLFGEEAPARGLAGFQGWTEEFATDVLDQYATKTELPSRRVVVSKLDRERPLNVVPLRRHWTTAP